MREYRTVAPARKGKFLDLAADLAATIHGMPRDLLSQEVRQQRRALTLAWSAAASLLVLAGAAAWQWQVAQTQRAKAENALTAATGTANRLVFDMAVDLRNLPGMPVNTVINILGRLEAMQSELAQAGNTTPELRRLEAAALGELATTLRDQGAFGHAQTAAERAVAIMADLVKLDPANTQYRRELAIDLNKLGDARFRSHDIAAALDLHNQALAIIQKLADADPADAQLQDDLVVALTRIGGVQIMMAKQADALDTVRRAAAILQGLVAKQPDNVSWQ